MRGLLTGLSTSVALLAQDPPPDPARPPLMLLPQSVALPRGERSIDVDGSLIDWPQLPALRLDDRRQLSGTAHGAFRGPADCSAAAFLMWDEDALYFACTVKDEWHRPLDANVLLLTEIPAADSVVLTFDPARDTRSNGPDPGREEDRDFWLADEAGREIVQWDRLRGTARVLDAPAAQLGVLHDKEHGLTSYEARIPWQEILPPGERAQAGRCFDLQIVVNDFDESTDTMAQTRIGWTFGVLPIVDPGLLGSVLLVADDAPLRGVVPEFPPKPGTADVPWFRPGHWEDLTRRLLATPPATYDGTVTPEETGGIERLRVLEEIERATERMPRVDYLELLQRIHRRMNREVAGAMGRGLPLWWRMRLASVSKLAEDPVPVGALRVFRLPMGGYLCRAGGGGFLIDAAGADLAEQLWGGAAFCVQTQPLDMTRRNDQLLVRMFAAEPRRPVFSHIVHHLPVVPMQDMPVVELGRTYGSATEPRVTPLGRAREDGTVPFDCSYRIEVPGAPSVLVVGPTLDAEFVDPEQPVGLLILSPRNPRAPLIADRASPRVVVVDDAFVCQTSTATQRVSLADLHALQRHLLPHPSVVLAPGESWLVEPSERR